MQILIDTPFISTPPPHEIKTKKEIAVGIPTVPGPKGTAGVKLVKLCDLDEKAVMVTEELVINIKKDASVFD